MPIHWIVAVEIQETRIFSVIMNGQAHDALEAPVIPVTTFELTGWLRAIQKELEQAAATVSMTPEHKALLAGQHPRSQNPCMISFYGWNCLAHRTCPKKKSRAASGAGSGLVRVRQVIRCEDTSTLWPWS